MLPQYWQGEALKVSTAGRGYRHFGCRFNCQWWARGVEAEWIGGWVG